MPLIGHLNENCKTDTLVNIKRVQRHSAISGSLGKIAQEEVRHE